ncbi:GatB/YqeY domain-containing protein [Candidatus Albibeggiatoa sp. nov. BB20]|uniref:GatB/YqeY domain-containing protein n=1 Tax=Candidatus Albibeggiatoa sp. nov. BB20 TaxID=3162723 RepID=UPI0033658F16
MADTLKQRIQEDMKTAMRAKEKSRLAVIRLILAAMKQIEVDQRIELDDALIIAVLDKMLKQRRDSIEQYEKAERQDLADQEKYEVGIIQTYLPQQLTDAELSDIIEAVIAETGAESIKDLGKVMGMIKPKVQGRADMKAVSQQIKQRLA